MMGAGDNTANALKHIELMATGEWREPSWLSQAEATALRDHIAKLASERDEFRIEADCAMRDYDALELRFGEMRDAIALSGRRVHDYSGMGF